MPRKWIGPNTKVIDLHGMLAIPGFIEGHGHFTGVGEFRMGLDLREARTWDDIVAQVARAAKQAKPGEWIVGRGWHQSKWDRRARPRTSKASRCTLRSIRSRPTIRCSSPTPAATPPSSTARPCELAGITGQTANPSGRRNPQRRQGRAHRPAPRSALKAANQPRPRRLRSQAHRRRPPRRNQRKAIDLAIDESLSKGITTFEDAGSPLATVDILKKMADAHELPHAHLDDAARPQRRSSPPISTATSIIGAGDDFFTVRAIKR